MSNNIPLGRKLYDAELLIATMQVELGNYKLKCDQLEQWKREATAILDPILEYGRKHPDIKLGASITDFVVERCKQYDELKAENERLNDQNKNVHEKNRKLSTEYAALKAKAQRLVDALEWYADDGNYFGDNGELATAWKKNMAKKAKAALQDWQNKEGV